MKADEVLGDYYTAIIADELNVKKVTFTDDMSCFTDYHFKPQLKTLGPKYGKQLGEIRTLLQNLNGAKAKKELDETGVLKLTLSTGEISLTVDDLLIEMTRSERYFSVEDGGVTVAIDTELTQELIEEGFVRELVSKIQTMRKEAGFEVEDHIIASVCGNEKIQTLMQANRALIADDVLADDLVTEPIDGYTKEWDLNGEAVTLTVKKV